MKQIYGLGVSKNRKYDVTNEILLGDMFLTYEDACKYAESYALSNYAPYDGYEITWDGDILQIYHIGVARTLVREISIEPFSLWENPKPTREYLK